MTLKAVADFAEAPVSAHVNCVITLVVLIRVSCRLRKEFLKSTAAAATCLLHNSKASCKVSFLALY